MQSSILHIIKLLFLMGYYECDGSIKHMTSFTSKNRVNIGRNMFYVDIMYEYVR